MLTPCNHDFSLYRGTTLRKTFTWKPGGVVANLVGYSAYVRFRLLTTDPTAAMSLTSQAGGVILGGIAGTLQMFATPLQLEGLAADVYLYELRLVYPNADVASLVQGRMTFILGAAH